MDFDSEQGVSGRLLLAPRREQSIALDCLIDLLEAAMRLGDLGENLTISGVEIGHEGCQFAPE